MRSKYGITQEIKHLDNVSFKEFTIYYLNQSDILQRRIDPSLRKDTCFYVDHSFLGNNAGCVFLMENTWRKCKIVKCFDVIVR